MTRGSFSTRLAAPFAVAALLLWEGSAMCSQIFHRPLAEVVDARTKVFAAKVTAVTRADERDTVRRFYDVSEVRWVVGTGAAAVRAAYSYRVPVMRDAQGREIGRGSPILDGSGEEGNVEPGQTWLFFTRETPSRAANGDAPTVTIHRIEPITREKEVRAFADAL